MGPLLSLVFPSKLWENIQQIKKNCLTLPFKTNVNYTFRHWILLLCITCLYSAYSLSTFCHPFTRLLFIIFFLLHFLIFTIDFCPIVYKVVDLVSIVGTCQWSTRNPILLWVMSTLYILDYSLLYYSSLSLINAISVIVQLLSSKNMLNCSLWW